MKFKVFATIALLASTALVGCGGKKTCEKHQWGKWEVTTPETCTVNGEETRKCSVCGEKETRPITAAHKFGEWSEKTPATCSAGGKDHRFCSVCSFEDEKDTPKTEHNWQTQGASAAVAGAAATEQFKCEFGDHYALRWSAVDMDEAASLAAMGLDAKDSTLYSEINTSGSHEGSIRLKVAENKGNQEAYGTHAVYKVNLGADATDIDLSFQIDPKSGFDVPVFDYVSNDDQQGYVKQADGSLVLTTKRYGLRVNGVEITLGEDLHGDVNGGSKLWFNWNVKLNLTSGVNTIDVYCLGGYRAYIYNFQLDGLTAAQLPAKASA